MSLDIAIKNVGDYYAAHYLADKNGFSKDIADKVKGWREQGSQSTPRKLGALSETYFKAKTEALNYDDPLLRVRADNEAINRWYPALLDALGYRPEPFGLDLESEKQQLPVLHRLNRHNRPWLVIAEAPFCLTGGEIDEEPLEQEVIARTRHVEGLPTLQASWEKAIALLFKQEDAPRWTMLLAGGRVYLFDAHTFSQGRYLWIDLDEAFGRRQASTFEAIAALLSDEALVPQGESDEVLHERLREGSLKSTHGVSAKLQGAVRDAIEAIANGWVDARRQNNLGYRQLSEREVPLPDGSREITAEQLRHDALIYVYRLLFCFYAEARGGELGILPINDDVYRLGYSLESLRDLVDANEPGTTTENGTYIAEHLARLFQLIYNGFDPASDGQVDNADESSFGQGPRQESLFEAPAGEQLSLSGSTRGRSKYTPGKVFSIQPLTATLFDPQATPLLSRVKLSNQILHKVIRCLSLGTSQQNKRIGRINYAELGIVQLGSVYEGLLSYKGFFATEDLIQVHQKAKNSKSMLDNAIDSKVPTWFVPATRENEFKAGEIVLEHRTERNRIYRAGEFILHLNGVDRVNSASYYTPEVLTRTLVEEALKERLKDFVPEQADGILKLKICEPAMGSAAFLVEAIDQLGHRYLELKQKQLGRFIDPSNYEDELRRVRHYIAVHNVYGVDLNPVAVELGALSLWLSTIHRLKVSEGDEDNQPLFQPAATPWFGLRLRAGNSLIGARRSVWKKDQLLRGKHYGKNSEIPRQLKPGEDRKSGEIYHFLVWDEDMAPAANDKLMREHWPTECDTIKTWRTKQVKSKCSVEDVARLERLSERIDELWRDYSVSRQRALVDTACTSTVWPMPQNSLDALRGGPTLRRQEGTKASLEAESGAFQRLKLLMDSWCSFYFWPLDQSDNLPSREAWLAAAEVLLGIGTDDLATRAMLDIQLGDEIELEVLFQASDQKLPDAEHLSELVPWFGVGRSTTAEQNFHHWELIFTEVLGPQVGDYEAPKGFDLMFGNPPWVGADWKAAPLLNEYEPLLGVRDSKSATYNRERPKLLQDVSRRDHYQKLFSAGEGAATFLNDVTLYPALAGLRTNLYKNFIERSWALLGVNGIAGLLHPESVFDDGRGGPFRASYYPRLLAHYQYENERQKELFAEVNARQTFSINIFGSPKERVEFTAIFNLFGGHTLKHCLKHNRPDDPIPGIKDANGDWEVKGHVKRALKITEKELTLFASLLDDDGTPASHARLPLVHSEPILQVLKKFSQASVRLGDLRGHYYASDMINEVNGQKDGAITRVENPSYQPASAEEWVISGPHFYVGNAFNKTPRTVCTEKNHYDSIDLENIPTDYLPRTVYRPGDENGNLDAFCKAIPEWPKPQKPIKTESGWQPGFWPVAAGDKFAYEALLGETLKLYGIDSNKPGAKTARKFGYFSRWEGAVEAALHWLKIHGSERNGQEFTTHFPGVQLEQGLPTNGKLEALPEPLTARPSLVYRRRGQPANERTLIPAIMPSGVTHINPVISFTFDNPELAVVFAGHSISILHDFLIRVAGRSDIYANTLTPFPITDKKYWPLIKARALCLSCLTEHYADLWEKVFLPEFKNDAFTSVGSKKWGTLTGPWSRDFAFRNEKDRRQAALELDALLALGFGLSVKELIQIYHVQFSALVEYEKIDEYDARGQRLPNTKRKDAGGTEVRAARADHYGVSPLIVSWKIDNGNQTVTKTFFPPFSHVDRIENYRTAYRVFSERLGLTENNKESA